MKGSIIIVLCCLTCSFSGFLGGFLTGRKTAPKPAPVVETLEQCIKSGKSACPVAEEWMALPSEDSCWAVAYKDDHDEYTAVQHVLRPNGEGVITIPNPSRELDRFQKGWTPAVQQVQCSKWRIFTDGKWEPGPAPTKQCFAVTFSDNYGGETTVKSVYPVLPERQSLNIPAGLLAGTRSINFYVEKCDLPNGVSVELNQKRKEP